MMMTISPIYIWVGVLIFCLVAEACTVQLITIWFAVGSVGAMAAAAMGFGETVQLGVCLAVAIVMLLLLIVPIMWFHKHQQKQMGEQG